MKKLIYGTLILIGSLLISTNFLADTSKIDHKKVSASGTACRWISESGYGTGPIYYDSSISVGTNINAQTVFKKRIKLVPCTTSNAGAQRNGGRLYSSNTSTSYFTGKVIGVSSGSYSSCYTGQYVQITEGLLKELRFANLSYSGSGALIGCTWPELRTYSGAEQNINLKVTYNYDEALENPDLYTCVCAEYYNG